MHRSHACDYDRMYELQSVRAIRALPDVALRRPMKRSTVNESTRRIHVVRLLGIAFATVLAVGCSPHRPMVAAKLAQAERAIDEAQQAGAEVSALKTAQDKLKVAQDA